MRFFVWFTLFLIVLLSSFFIFLSTSYANHRLKEFLEYEIKSRAKVDIQINHLKITSDRLMTEIIFDKKSILKFNAIYSLLEQKIDCNYDINISHGEFIERTLHHQIRGTIGTKGTIRGSFRDLKIEGYSNIADGETIYKASVVNFDNLSLSLESKEILFEELLYLLGYVPYANAITNIELNLHSKAKDIDSFELKLIALNGKVNTTLLQKEFNYFFPRTVFNATIQTHLDKNVFKSKVALNSSLFKIKSQNLQLDSNDFSIKGNYELAIEDLQKLYFLTHRELNGAMYLDGTFVKKNDLDIVFHSNIAQGELRGKLHNEQLSANLESLNSLDVLRIIKYPSIFDSTLNGTLEYDFFKEFGKLKVQLAEGRFMSNEPFDMIEKYTHANLYKEKFKGDLEADIRNEYLIGSLDLQSNNTNLSTKNTYLDAQKKVIDSKVKVLVKDYPIHLNVKGDVDSPRVSVDLKKLMNSKTGDMIQNEMMRLLKNLF